MVLGTDKPLMWDVGVRIWNEILSILPGTKLGVLGPVSGTEGGDGPVKVPRWTVTRVNPVQLARAQEHMVSRKPTTAHTWYARNLSSQDGDCILYSTSVSGFRVFPVQTS